MDKYKFKSDFSERLIKFSLKIINLCRKLKEDRVLYILGDQLIRSGCSVGANIVEAKCASSKKEYARFFKIALNSANESIYWLILIANSDSKYENLTQELRIEAEEISKIIAASIITMKSK